MSSFFAKDPKKQFKYAYQAVYAIGIMNIILTLILGYLIGGENNEIWLSLIIYILMGVIFIVLGYFVQKMSLPALTIAVVILALDLVFTFKDTWNLAQSGNFYLPVFKLMALLFMVGGFKAIKVLRQKGTAVL